MRTDATRTTRLWSSLRTACALTLLAGSVAQAQRTLRGTVVDSAGQPLANVEIRIMELGKLTRSDVAGHFAIPGLTQRVVDVTARRMGYQVRFMRVAMMNGEGDSLRVEMRAEPVRLGGVEIEAPEEVHPFFIDFEKRRARGIGTFITREQIEKYNTSSPSDAFRALPGMKLVRVGNGMGIRFMSTVGMRKSGGRECVPTIWMDGQAAPGLEIDDIRAGDIQGIEIYRGVSTTPPQFATAGSVQCGVIAVWTRRKK